MWQSKLRTRRHEKNVFLTTNTDTTYAYLAVKKSVVVLDDFLYIQVS